MSIQVKKPVRLSLSGQILGEMERCIRDGRWAVGMKIPAEPELVAMFSVSRNTVREAVQSLIHAGLLVARPGDGTYVLSRSRMEAILNHQLKDTEFAKVLEARLALEKSIVRLAARHRTEEDLGELEKLLADRNRTHGGDADVLFHAAVARATHNPILTGFYEVVCRYMQSNMPQSLGPDQTPEAESKLHDDLLDAIRRQDADEACEITYEIIQFYTVRSL